MSKAMRIWPKLISFLLAAVLALTLSSSSNDDKNNEEIPTKRRSSHPEPHTKHHPRHDSHQQQHQTSLSSATNKFIECGIYLAPSSIPGSGLGMYAGNRTFHVNDIVTDEDIVVPIFEREWHSNVKGKFLWDEYIWNGDVFDGMEQEMENGDMDEISVASPGVGAAANSYMSLVNVEDNDVVTDMAGIAKDSPGRGAFTIYNGRSFFALDLIRPGQELFVSYGNKYFKSRKRIYGYLPLPDDDYDEADDILNTALELTIDNEDLDDKRYELQIQSGKADSSAWEARKQEMWEDLHSFIVDVADIYNRTSRVLNAVPTNASIVEAVLDDGGTAYQDLNRSIKELHWLEENGQCMDNIRTGVSSIPHAGRGAFASRFIPKDGLVSPAPLIHIKNMEMIRTYFDLKRNSKGFFVPDRKGRSSYQLILNYCFAHEQSTLLLCPYGLLTSLINHSHKNPNTKIVWAKEMRHKEWLNQPIADWGDEYHTGLQFDFVATRDISAGEEISIDYGNAWQSEWDKHVDSFVIPEPKNYVPSFGLNELLEELELRTVQDREYELDNVQLRCHLHYVKKLFHGGIAMKEDPACRIVRKLENGTYLVRIVNWFQNDNDQTVCDTGKLMWGVPKAAFYFADMPLSRDHHQHWAFRHAMMIPDEIFPDIWRNIADAESFTEYEDEDD
ncbi:SET methyltransferase domain containing protein [Nitzschia inconspicua]|uniref:SET methyltransferase domain containing protein n=1 Tax=Nitzschia inconspicua TaxID=303405 RepID=A0A9K3L0N5_9STRA|nr:SET methyltransferase domain containing protein [Nitzschia inconspicua]